MDNKKHYAIQVSRSSFCRVLPYRFEHTTEGRDRCVELVDMLNSMLAPKYNHQLVEVDDVIKTI